VAKYEDLIRKRRACNNNNDRGKEITINDVTTGEALADNPFSMIISSHSFSNNEIAPKKPLFFDTSSKVNITPDYGNFKQNSIMDLNKRLYSIITGGGRVKAKAFGLFIEYLIRPDGFRRSVRFVHNIVDDDVTDSDNGTVKRKIGRPKKKKIKLYRYMLEAFKKDSEVLQLLEQKGAIADKKKTATFAEKFADFSITRLTLADNFGDFAAL
jgi:hypothetical protein